MFDRDAGYACVEVVAIGACGEALLASLATKLPYVVYFSGFGCLMLVIVRVRSGLEVFLGEHRAPAIAWCIIFLSTLLCFLKLLPNFLLLNALVFHDLSCVVLLCRERLLVVSYYLILDLLVDRCRHIVEFPIVIKDALGNVLHF